MTSVNFTRPTEWFGKAICIYQLLRGVKYWQFSHCNILTDEGAYAYNLDEEYTGEMTEAIQFGTLVPAEVDLRTIRARHLTFLRVNGHFSPRSIVNSRHCVGHVKYCLNLPQAPNLPGQLYEYLTEESTIWRTP